MKRLAMVALILSPTALVVACEAPNLLASSKPGDCFEVVGKDSLGAPKVKRIQCAALPAEAAASQTASVDPAVAAAPPATATASTTAPTLTCPQPTVQVVCPGASANAHSGSTVGKTHSATRVKAVSHRASSRRAQSSGGDRYTVGGGGAYIQEDLGIDYARPQSDHGYASGSGYARQDAYQRNEAIISIPQPDRLPPPPRPAYAPPPPPPVIQERRIERHASGRAHQSYSSSSSTRESYSYRSSSHVEGGRNCRCGPGPHFPIDGQGFLTWHGKTPG